MEIPMHLHARALEVINMQLDQADKARLWSTIYQLSPFRDGNSWCVLLGPNLQAGVAGFGRTPTEALHNFESAMDQAGGQAGAHHRQPTGEKGVAP